ncbi:phospholipase A1-like [Prorops nasuta]|uniref:phospholipase A1-like n=1 Tax=Prorops nasuta TaxID=863751 RepID=UPI0034CE2092
MVAAPLALLYPAFLLAFTHPEEYTVLPDETGRTYLIDLREENATYSQEELQDLYRSELDTITFTLYTRENLTGELINVNDIEALNRSQWNPTRKSKIITHGWKSNGQNPSCISVLDAYMNTTEDYNVFIMDWNKLAGSLFYFSSARAVPVVGEYLGAFIDFLYYEGNLKYSDVQLVGHSLGAHIVGLAARKAKGVIPEVVGLDPALVGFRKSKPGERIDHSDADHVQIIHTTAGTIGFADSIGKSDFYPNDGKKQPGCKDFFGVCDHSRAYYYFAESIISSNGFRASPINDDKGHVYMGGSNLDSNAKGSYTLKTNSNSPFALG